MGNALAVCLPPPPPEPDDDDDLPNPDNPRAEFTLSGGVSGSFVVEVFLDRIPRTASNFIDLAQTGFYNGLHFHRTIPRTYAPMNPLHSICTTMDDEPFA